MRNRRRVCLLFSDITMMGTSKLSGTTLAVTQYMPLVGTEKLDAWCSDNSFQELPISCLFVKVQESGV